MIPMLGSLPLYSKLLLAFVISWLAFTSLARPFRAWLSRREMIDHFRSDSPASHRSKVGTPSGGGLLILLALAIPVVLLVPVAQPWVYVLLGATLYFGLVGYLDDSLKRARASSRGLSARRKLLLQVAAALAVVALLYLFKEGAAGRVHVPFWDTQLDLGWGYIPFAVIVIIGAANAVNLSDGLDGLAAGCMMPPAMVLVIAGVAGAPLVLTMNGVVSFSGQAIGVFWLALLGALIGFLRYNRYPAKMFMGEVGSQALGGALGVSAILLKLELLLFVLGGVFVAETLSVVLQVASYRLIGKRLFRMTPLHHHFELAGHSERAIVRGFWTAGSLLALICLVMLLQTSAPTP